MSIQCPCSKDSPEDAFWRVSPKNEGDNKVIEELCIALRTMNNTDMVLRAKKKSKKQKPSFKLSDGSWNEAFISWLFEVELFKDGTTRTLDGRKIARNNLYYVQIKGKGTSGHPCKNLRIEGDKKGLFTDWAEWACEKCKKNTKAICIGVTLKHEILKLDLYYISDYYQLVCEQLKGRWVSDKDFDKSYKIYDVAEDDIEPYRRFEELFDTDQDLLEFTERFKQLGKLLAVSSDNIKLEIKADDMNNISMSP